MEESVKKVVVGIIKEYNDNSIKYSILEKRTSDVRTVLDGLEKERKELFDELKDIRDREHDMLDFLSKDENFDMEAFKAEIQEIAKNIGSE